MRKERFVINDRSWSLIEPLVPRTVRGRGVTTKDIPHQVDKGTSIEEEVCLKISICQQTYYRWLKNYGGLNNFVLLTGMQN